MRALILGGTAEARRLAERLARMPWTTPILSLAGLTGGPSGAYETRRGGFGGAEGLAAHLQAARIELLIDATHPYAVRISQNAALAAAATGAPLLRLERRPWTPDAGETWIEAPDLETAAEIPPRGARVFLALGPESLEPFKARRDLWCAVRRIERTADPLPLAQGEWVIGRPSQDAAEEEALFRRHLVGWLITKNSGGARAKLDAARRLGLSVVMAARPALAPAETAASVAEAIAWALARSPGRGARP